MPSTSQAVQDQLLRAMSPEQKLLVSDGLRHAAWALKAAWIRSQHPELDSAEVQERVRRIFRDAGARHVKAERARLG